MFKTVRLTFITIKTRKKVYRDLKFIKIITDVNISLYFMLTSNYYLSFTQYINQRHLRRGDFPTIEIHILFLYLLRTALCFHSFYK